MEKIRKSELEIKGNWVFENGKIIEDEVSKRINYLKDNYLKKISVSASGWEILYQDPNDMRYWELTHLFSGEHGAGPPSLFFISKEEAVKKYSL